MVVNLLKDGGRKLQKRSHRINEDLRKGRALLLDAHVEGGSYRESLK